MTSLYKKIVYAVCYIIFISPTWLKNIYAKAVEILWYDVSRIRRKLVRENIQMCFPDWSRDQVLKVARASFWNQGKTIVDFATLAWLKPSETSQYVSFEGLHHLEEALKQKKGVLLLGLHLSNGDFGISHLAAQGYKVHLISKRFTSQWLDELWFDIRSRFGTQFIAVRRSSFEILKALKNDGVVIFVLDQFMGPPLGVKTTFFGKPTGTAMGLALFAEKTRAPVVPCYTYRETSGQYKVVFEPPLAFESTGNKNTDLQHMTQKYTDKLEEFVRRYPEQWLWVHRRWKVFNET